MVDLKSNIDVTSRMPCLQARKILAEVFNYDLNLVSFTKHAREQMKVRDLKTGDVLNVLKAGSIVEEPELVNESFRYRVSTSKITVVIAFRKPHHIVVITAWRE